MKDWQNYRMSSSDYNMVNCEVTEDGNMQQLMSFDDGSTINISEALADAKLYNAQAQATLEELKKRMFDKEVLEAYGKSTYNKQVGGSHYSDMVIQPVEYIVKNKLGYLEGNVVKYISRHASKNGAEDIKKAIQYCEFILEEYYNG